MLEYRLSEFARELGVCIHRAAEKAHSRRLVVASPGHQHTVYSAQSSVNPCSCSLVLGYSHTCCEDLLRGATGYCSRVAGELVLCSQERRCAPQTTQDYRSSHAGTQCLGPHTTTLHSTANVSRLNSPILRYSNRNSLGAKEEEGDTASRSLVTPLSERKASEGRV